MTFIDSVKTCFKKILDIQGRASRSEYWWFVLFVALVPTIVMFFLFFVVVLLGGGNLADSNSFVILILLISFGPAVVALTTVSVRRLHDLNKSGWYVAIYYALDLIAILPVISPTLSNILLWLSSGFYIYLTVIFMFKGSNKKNKYGSPIKL